MILESQENVHKRAFELSLDPMEATEVGDKTVCFDSSRKTRLSCSLQQTDISTRDA